MLQKKQELNEGEFEPAVPGRGVVVGLNEIRERPLVPIGVIGFEIDDASLGARARRAMQGDSASNADGFCVQCILSLTTATVAPGAGAHSSCGFFGRTIRGVETTKVAFAGPKSRFRFFEI